MKSLAEHLTQEQMLDALKERVLRELMDGQTTQSFGGALRADPSRVVISAKDAQSAVERLQRYVVGSR